MQGQTYFSKSELLKCNSHLNLISLSRSQAIPVITYSPSKFDLQFSIFGSCDFQGLRHTDVHASEFFFTLKGSLIFKGFQKMFQIFSLKQQIRILKEFLECLETQNSSPKTAAFELCSSFSRDRESSFESRLSTFEYMGGICASNSEILALLGKAYKFCTYYSAWSLVHGIIKLRILCWKCGFFSAMAKTAAHQRGSYTLYLNIIMHILHTVLHTFPRV